MKIPDKRSELQEALTGQKKYFQNALFFSFFTNLLVMAPTIYMLEVYDRVVNSRSGMTLAMLTLLVVGLYALMEALEWVRMEVLQFAGRRFDAKTSERVFDSVFEANLRRIPGTSVQALNDLRTVREFLASPALIAIMDAPLAMLYIVVLFMINTTMGYMAIVGALVAVALAYFNERDTLPSLTVANRSAIDAQNYAIGSLRNAQVIEAMGMLGSIHGRWMKKQKQLLFMQASASDAAGTYSSLSKFVQLAQTSLLLGAGCWLTILGQFEGGGGMMIVASILGGRVLAPISQVIGMWKHVVNARDAYFRLNNLLQVLPARQPGMSLPAPKGLLSVEAVTAAAPNSNVAIIRGASFVVPAGKVVAVVGPSASGKTTLARLIVGVWPAASGKVRLDGVDIFPWNKAELGPHIGYLPQDVELFDGTLAENIARFGPVDMARVEAAARAVGVHETIMALPQGYESAIGDDGCFLSGGQRQRVGLARAIFGNPHLLVLDEPNSSLDEAGEQALVQTLLALKAQGTTILVITHRTSVLQAVDLMLLLVEGQVKAYGPRDEVLAALRGKAQAPAALANPPAAPGTAQTSAA
ncbi:MAG: peptidase [Betaproteobacteria bacterium RIFCSPLOWO2_12_FULL_65_110]|nr:MAG: peptidase [Betaproteobacteria bacterium RIFCSPLOWO2_02_FULL_65_20]OGA37810.1 MAG: peptidase [Betaproteobacteria bacterium RIFCSPLOWO2_12_FULL_65_110]